MEYHELQNYGKIYTGKLSAKVMMAVFTSVPKELGFIGTPKFLTKMQGKERYWKGRLAKIAEPRGITNSEFVEGNEWNLGFFSALVATLGEERALEAYSKLVEKLAVIQYEDFYPTAKNFQACRDPWEALRGYFLEFLRTNDKENTMRFEVVKDSDKTINELITNLSATTGEKITIRRFARFEVGEGLEKRVNDLAAEVAEMQKG